MLPIFTYLTWVAIHTPTPMMYFYNCPQRGMVTNFLQDDLDGGKMKYQVDILCPNGKFVQAWIPAANLRKEEK